jgi:hypothetical protein
MDQRTAERTVAAKSRCEALGGTDRGPLAVETGLEDHRWKKKKISQSLKFPFF